MVGLVLCEAVVRLAGPGLPASFTTRALQEPHPLLGVFHRPGASAWIRDPEFTTFVRFDRNGLRGPELQARSVEPRPRVLVLGDSFVEGAEVDEADALPAALGSSLAAAGKPAEVLNAGVRGWGTTQELLYLSHLGLQLEPDIVVLVFYVGNDLVDNSRELSGSAADGAIGRPFLVLGEHGSVLAQPSVSARSPLASLSGTARAHSALFNLVENGVVTKLAYADRSEVLRSTHRVAFAAPPPPAWERAWALTEGLLVAARDAAEERGARFLVVAAPHKAQLDPNDWERLVRGAPVPGTTWDRRLPQDRLRAVADNHGIQLLDLLPALEMAEGAGTLYFAENSHWTAAGHRVVADAIAEVLLADGSRRAP